jgi:hypothetical protein
VLKAAREYLGSNGGAESGVRSLESGAGGLG